MLEPKLQIRVWISAIQFECVFCESKAYNKIDLRLQKWHCQEPVNILIGNTSKINWLSWFNKLGHKSGSEFELQDMVVSYQ